jgi:protoporphyrin/coproporphyrin ferrochelatase
MGMKQEPAYTHGQGGGTAVVICNLGTPDAPTAPAVRRYLREFLSDTRVIEIPRVIWWIILHGIILVFRPAKSAAKYASIWQPGGSPLMVETQKLARAVQQRFSPAPERGQDLSATDVSSLSPRSGQVVTFAMRYGQPSIATVLDQLKATGIDRVLVVPAYPQYSATTTASVMDAVGAWLSTCRNQPEMRFVKHYHDDSHYIGALAASIERYWEEHGKGDQLLMSFHGVPQRTLALGDPYHCECYKTARLLRERLGLPPEAVKVTFQSRLGRAKWLEPYTEPSLIALAQQGVKRVDVVCPGFLADCLETLEEIAMEGKHAFIGAGGQSFHYIPCLNDDPMWVEGMAKIIETHCMGWPTSSPTSNEQQQSRENALALGAQN